MSHGLVYHYFVSKEEVFTALVEEACQGGLWAVTVPAQVPGSPWEKLSWMVNAVLMGVRAEPRARDDHDSGVYQ